MSRAAKKQPAQFGPGQLVTVMAGVYAGQVGQVRGTVSATGTYPVMIGDKVRRIGADKLGVLYG
jgi:transcription antitermination factor NusG